MKTRIRVVLPAALLLLAACDPLFYAKVDAPSVAITQSLPGPIPGAPQVPVTVPTSLIQYSFDIGQVTVDQSSKDSSLTLNGATVAITSSGPPSFSGIDELDLVVAPPSGDPTLTAVTVARYSKSAGVGTLSTDGKTLTLAPPEKVELLPYLQGTVLTVSLSGSGILPGPVGTTWTADVTIDFHVIAQKNLP